MTERSYKIKKKNVFKPLLLMKRKNVSSAEFRHSATILVANICPNSQQDRENAPVRTVTRSEGSGL